MSESLTLFAATELTADHVDAVPGIEPPVPAPPPEVDYASIRWWLIEYLPPLGGSEPEFWCADLQIAKEYVRRLNLKEEVHVVIKRSVFDPTRRITSEGWFSKGPLQPRDFHVACLDLDAESKRLLVNRGYHRLGQIADISWAHCARMGLTPTVCRELQKLLAKHGLSMSFECFPGERYGWSPKRRSA